MLDRSNAPSAELAPGVSRTAIAEGSRGSKAVTVSKVVTRAGPKPPPHYRPTEGAMLIADGELEDHLGNEVQTIWDESCVGVPGQIACDSFTPKVDASFSTKMRNAQPMNRAELIDLIGAELSGYHRATDFVAERFRAGNLDRVWAERFPLDSDSQLLNQTLPVAWESVSAELRVRSRAVNRDGAGDLGPDL